MSSQVPDTGASVVGATICDASCPADGVPMQGRQGNTCLHRGRVCPPWTPRMQCRRLHPLGARVGHMAVAQGQGSVRGPPQPVW